MLFLFCRSRSERQGGQGDVVYPIGYSEKPVPDTSIQETDKNLVEKVSAQEDLITYVFQLLLKSHNILTTSELPLIYS